MAKFKKEATPYPSAAGRTVYTAGAQQPERRTHRSAGVAAPGPAAPMAQAAPTTQAAPAAPRPAAPAAERPGVIYQVLLIVSAVLMVIGLVLFVLGFFVMKAPQAAPAAQPPVAAAEPGAAESTEPAAPVESDAGAAQEPADAAPDAESAAEEPTPAESTEVTPDADTTQKGTVAARGDTTLQLVLLGTDSGSEAGSAGNDPFNGSNNNGTVADVSNAPAAKGSPLKTPFTLLGALLMLLGGILGLVDVLMLQAKIKAVADDLARAHAKAANTAKMYREPTVEEKLHSVFDQVPVIDAARSREMEQRAAQELASQRVAPAPAQVRPAAPAAPAPAPAPTPQSRYAMANEAFNALLGQGDVQAATQQIIGSASYMGAGIDVQNCLQAYQSGQMVPYRVTGAEKSWNCPLFVAMAGRAPVALYPNPYAVEQLGLAHLQDVQAILYAFDVLDRSGNLVTPQTVAALPAPVRVLRAQGAQLSAQGTVAQKGRIELG